MRDLLDQPVALQTLLSSCCGARRGRATVQRALVAARWRQLVGDAVSRHTAVLQTDGAVVTIGVANAAWQQRLEREQRVLLDAFGPLPGGRRVRRLRFVVDPRRLRGDDAGTPPEESYAPPPGADVGFSPNQAFALQDWPEGRAPELRDAIEAWMRAASAPPARERRFPHGGPEGR